MILRSRDGNELILSIARYQFRSVTDPTDWDCWHTVEGSAKDSERSWSFRDSALMCSESPQISSWLTRVAKAEWHNPVLDFMEPNLAFRVVESGKEFVTFEVALALEFHPLPARERSEPLDSPYLVCLIVDRPALLSAAMEWDLDLKRILS